MVTKMKTFKNNNKVLKTKVRKVYASCKDPFKSIELINGFNVNSKNIIKYVFFVTIFDFGDHKNMVLNFMVNFSEKYGQPRPYFFLSVIYNV